MLVFHGRGNMAQDLQWELSRKIKFSEAKDECEK